jgi:hypothetical protein
MIQMRNESREFTVAEQGAAPDRTGRRTQKTITAVCPFCGASVKIYVWSLCGGGKLCRCGAKFQSGGRCQRLVEIPQVAS